jgi:hypothetical protein
MPDEIDVQMMVLVFGTETGAETGLAALRKGTAPATSAASGIPSCFDETYVAGCR